jgi:hypothetical protein
MTRESKLKKKEQEEGYFRMFNLKSVSSGNKVVETEEEARRLGREKAKESGRKLKLEIKI